MIQSIKDKLEKRQEDLKSMLRTKEDSQLSTNSALDVYRLQLSNFKEDMKAYEVFDSSEENIENKINQLRDEANFISLNINKYNEESREKDKQVESLNSEYSKTVLDSSSELDGKLKPISDKIKDKNDEINNLKTEIKILEKEIKKLDSITDVCPTCGQKIPNVNKPNTTSQKQTLSGMNDNLSVLTSELTELNTEKKSITDKHNFDRDAKLDRISADIAAVKDDLRNMSTQNLRDIRELGNINDEISNLTNLKQNYNKLISNIESTEETILKLENTLSELSGEIIDIKAHLDIIQQMVTLAKREFRGILLINIIDYINKRIKQYSQVVFDTEELDFSLNENEVDISYCGKPYENLSGGEKQKIDVIIQLALRDILSKQLNIRSNLLVCDEIFDNMDLVGCNKIIDLISGLSDIDSVFIISHHAQDLELTKDNSLIVEKSEDGISQIKFV